MIRLSAVVLCCLLPAVAMAQTSRKFTVVNHTGVKITEIYASPKSAESWEEDILDGDRLDNHDVQTIDIEDGRTDCIYDVMMVFADGDQVAEEANVCDAEVMNMVSE